MWSADRTADRSRGGGLPQKQTRDNENSSRVSDRICTNILEASPRAMSMTILRKLLNTDRATLSPLCQEGQTAVRRMPRSHVRHRLVRGSDSNNCVLSRLGASLLQLFLRSTCSLLSMFAFQVIRPCTFSGSSHRGVDRSRHAQDYSSSSVVLLPRGSTLSRRGLLTSRAAIVAPRTPEGDKLTSRAAVVAPRTPEGD